MSRLCGAVYFLASRHSGLVKNAVAFQLLYGAASQVLPVQCSGRHCQHYSLFRTADQQRETLLEKMSQLDSETKELVAGEVSDLQNKLARLEREKRQAETSADTANHKCSQLQAELVQAVQQQRQLEIHVKGLSDQFKDKQPHEQVILRRLLTWRGEARAQDHGGNGEGPGRVYSRYHMDTNLGFSLGQPGNYKNFGLGLPQWLGKWCQVDAERGLFSATFSLKCRHGKGKLVEHCSQQGTTKWVEFIQMG